MDVLVILVIGFVSSFFGSFVSGGLSMLSLPALLLFGLPPHIALGTYRLGAFGYNAGGFLQYFKNEKIVWKFVLPLSGIAIVAGLLGSTVIIHVDESLLTRLVGACLLLLVPIVFFKPDLGLISKEVGKKSHIIGYFMFGLASLYGASIATGQGIFIVYSIMYFFGLPLLNSIATAKIPSALTSIAVLTVFGVNGLIHWQYALILFIGMVAGSYIGTHYAIKLGNKWLRNILLTVIILLALKLIFGF